MIYLYFWPHYCRTDTAGTEQVPMGDNLATSLSSWQVTALREEPDNTTGQGGAEGWSRQRPWPQRRTLEKGGSRVHLFSKMTWRPIELQWFVFSNIYYTPTLQPLLNWLFEGIVLQVEVTNKYLPSQGLGEGSESTMQCMFESSSQKNAWREQWKTQRTRTVNIAYEYHNFVIVTSHQIACWQKVGFNKWCFYSDNDAKYKLTYVASFFHSWMDVKMYILPFFQLYNNVYYFNIQVIFSCISV